VGCDGSREERAVAAKLLADLKRLYGELPTKDREAVRSVLLELLAATQEKNKV
jgi:hypothetical protein